MEILERIIGKSKSIIGSGLISQVGQIVVKI